MEKFMLFVTIVLIVISLSLSIKCERTNDQQNMFLPPYFKSLTPKNAQSKNMSSNSLNVETRMRVRRQFDELNYELDETKSITQLMKELGNISEILFQIFYKNPTKRDESVDDGDKIHFPDENVADSSEVSSDCIFGLCENVTNYPSEKIRNIISRSSNVRKYFENQPPSFDIPTRSFDGEENLCATRSVTTLPQTALNIKKEKKIIINIDNYTQAVVFELCVHADKECKHASNFPDGYSTICKQKYFTTRLLVLGSNSDSTIDTFKVPSCCVCMTKEN